ncbi:quinolinate synthase NadA [Natronospora cellulosivora (SeqCode)]
MSFNDNKEIIQEIEELKAERNAIILAHYYQPNEVQDIADYLGDSFGLSQKAATTNADLIVFCGVKFMGESAKILSPEKTVLLPEKMAGCPMADMVDADALRKMKKKYPEHTVITYVNSSAEVKAESDVCCTSSNALKIVEAIDNDKILFVPDQNLGTYVANRTDKEVVLWEGYCNTHHRVELDEIKKVKELHPDAPILIHPESKPEVLALADYAGSTAGILKYARESSADTLIIGTEQGILHQLKKESPEKTFYLLSSKLICPNMKKTNLNKVLNALLNMESKVEIDENIRVKAYRALNKMLELAR